MRQTEENIEMAIDTACPRSSDPIYIVRYYIKWVTTSWTYSKIERGTLVLHDDCIRVQLEIADNPRV